MQAAVESARRAVLQLGSAPALSSVRLSASGSCAHRDSLVQLTDALALRQTDPIATTNEFGDQLQSWLDSLRLPEQSEEDLVLVLRAIRICRFPSKVQSRTERASESTCTRCAHLSAACSSPRRSSLPRSRCLFPARRSPSGAKPPAAYCSTSASPRQRRDSDSRRTS